MIASFILGGCILLFAIMSVSNINSPEIGVGGLQFVVLNVLGDTVGKIFLICVVIAITVCCLAVQTATIRMIFAMARDNNLPARRAARQGPPEDEDADRPRRDHRAAGDPDPGREHQPAADLPR